MDILFNQKTYDIDFVSSGDFVDIAIVQSTIDEVMQKLFLRFKTFKRDLMWNTDYGIDYLRDVFGINRPKYTVDLIIQNEIEKEPMVEKLITFESEIKNYTYSCKFRVSVKDEKVVLTYYVLTTQDGLTILNENGDKLTLKLRGLEK